MNSENLLLLLMVFCNCKTQIECADPGILTGVSMAQFKDDCTNVYSGVMDGTRCFFIANNGAQIDWLSACDACAVSGGTLAQIHTKSEFNAITGMSAMINALTQSDVTMAAKHTEDVVDYECWIATDKFLWYTSATSYNTVLTGAHSWISTHDSDDCDIVAGVCAGFFTNGGNPPVLVGDVDCAWAAALCVMAVPLQSYTYYAGVCLQETALSTQTLATADDCAMACSHTLYCRSFNYWTDTGMCELFVWTSLDGPSSISDDCCWHYDYVP